MYDDQGGRFHQVISWDEGTNQEIRKLREERDQYIEVLSGVRNRLEELRSSMARSATHDVPVDASLVHEALDRIIRNSYGLDLPPDIG